LLYNSFSFFDLYADKTINEPIKKLALNSTILDKWILLRITETETEVTNKLDLYDVGGAARDIENLVNDLSRWYIRRSRKRLQRPENDSDYMACSGILCFALLEIAKLIAPFAPFFADALYISLHHKKESVHLEDWPVVAKKGAYVSDVLIVKMDEIRKIASIALAERAAKSIKVRQPLKSITIKPSSTKLTLEDGELLELLKDEVNVKDIIFADDKGEDIVLDVEINNELREEGTFRELLRAVQDLRQDAGLKMRDTISLFIDGPESIKFIVTSREKQFAKDVNARSVSASRTQKFDAEIQTKIDDFGVWIGIQK
jgi:isoleucyl-tRNA synthetase